MNAADDTLLSAGDIHVNIAQHQLLSEIYIALHKNELIGLIGPNGAGKSTLLNVMAGLRSPNRGSVELLYRPLQQYPSGQCAQLVSWLAQQGHVHWQPTQPYCSPTNPLHHSTPAINYKQWNYSNVLPPTAEAV